MAGYHLAYKNYSDAFALINKGLSLATTGSDSFNALWQYKVRAFLENEEDPDRFKKTLQAIDEFTKLSGSSYMSVNMEHYKGHCLRQTGEYYGAIEAYMKSSSLLDAISQGIIRASDGALYFVNPTLPPVANAVDYYGSLYAHLKDDPEAKKRLIRLRASLTKSDNAKRIAACYIRLKDYDEAIIWAGRIDLQDIADLRDYFALADECGRIDFIVQLFGMITAMRPDPRKHKIMDECFEAFNKVVLPHPHAEDILAPFLDAYTEHARDYAKRTQKGCF
jgi:tetratricopeptide (TPR) repeat protein